MNEDELNKDEIDPRGQYVFGAWEPVGEEWEVPTQVPVVVKGFSDVPVQTIPLSIVKRVEKRPVWKFVGYEERTVES